MPTLSIKAKFFCQNGKIKKIDLAPTQGDLTWEIIADEKNEALEKTIHAWMNNYMESRPSKTLLPLALDDIPAYNKKILLELLEIPFGKTVSYKDLAVKTNNPRAARAVGNACGRNPFPLVIPCHRVLKSNGDLGGFAFGTPMKAALLNFEKQF
jgi:methylated-DNA-[protein]-cysteine S-methyltransferase